MAGRGLRNVRAADGFFDSPLRDRFGEAVAQAARRAAASQWWNLSGSGSSLALKARNSSWASWLW